MLAQTTIDEYAGLVGCPSSIQANPNAKGINPIPSGKIDDGFGLPA